MAPRGMLNLSNIASTMPAISPLFPEFPIVCKNAENISIAFETDADAALRVLPEPLELAEPATAYLNTFRVHESAMGAYNEATLVLEVLWKGEPARYNVLQFVDNDMSFAVGREVLGSPKKLAYIEMGMRPEGMFGFAERPRGHRLLTLGVTLEEAIDVDSAMTVPGAASIGLRIIANADGESPAVSAELLATRSTWSLASQWSGRGSIAFPEASAIDNWQILPVLKIKRAVFSRFESISIPRPKLLARLSESAAAVNSGR